MPGVPMRPAMIEGAMKMPEPIMEPTISVVALKTPRRRSSVSAMAAFDNGMNAFAKNRVIQAKNVGAALATKAGRPGDARRRVAERAQAHARRLRSDRARNRRHHRHRHLLDHR